MHLAIREVTANQIVIKSKLPKAPYVINPYTGCHFGCVYCYADFMRRFGGHSTERWGEFVDVKMNAADLLVGDVGAGKDILLSSVTDPYQPLEARYKLTRSILERLVALHPQPTIGILTKSALVTRDLDIIRRFADCTVGFSIATLDDRVRRALEPVTPPIEKRLGALRETASAGIRTYAFVSPIMPYLTDISAIVSAVRESAGFLMFENLNVRGSIWGRLRVALEQLDATLIPRYEAIYASKESRRAYWEPVRHDIERLSGDVGLEAKVFFYH